MRHDRLPVSAISIRSLNNYCTDCQLLPFQIKCHIWSLDCSSAPPSARLFPALQCHANIEMRSCGKGSLFPLCLLAEMRHNESVCLSIHWCPYLHAASPWRRGKRTSRWYKTSHALHPESPSGAMCWDSTCFKALVFAVCSCLLRLEIPCNTKAPSAIGISLSSSNNRVIDS